MRTVKIVDLYGEALGLNGDERAVTAVTQRLSEMGYGFTVEEPGIGDPIDLADADLVFITHGKPQTVSALSEHFCRYKDEILRYIESGKPMVVTGSANLLFGKSFSMLDGKTYEGIGLFDCTAAEFDSLYVTDAVLEPQFAPGEKAFGCYYRCESVVWDKEPETPLFCVIKANSGEGAVGKTEGVRYKNLFATWCLGPILVRSPAMMREVLQKTLGEDYMETDFTLEEAALRRVLQDLGQ